MHKSFFILAAATSLTACVHTDPDMASRGVEPINVPVVTHSTYVFDAAAPDGSLSSLVMATAFMSTVPMPMPLGGTSGRWPANMACW
jgi:acyl dehydratase